VERGEEEAKKEGTKQWICGHGTFGRLTLGWSGMVLRGTSGQTGTHGLLIAENIIFLPHMTVAS